MAIIKNYLNTQDISVLSAWMNSHLVPTYFDSVSIESGLLVCRDADGNSIYTSTGYTGTSQTSFTMTIYASPTLSKSWSNMIGFGHIYYASMCSNGCIITFGDPGLASACALLITKTNNNVTSIVFSGSSSGSVYPTNHTCIAWGDISPISSFAYTPIKDSQQTQIVPFLSGAPYGTISYTPNAFYVPIGQYHNVGDFDSKAGMNPGQLVLNGNTYLYNGYWAIKDDTVPTS